MAQFTNQAQLSYNNSVTSSNIAVGEIIEVLSATKTAVIAYPSGSTTESVIIPNTVKTINALAFVSSKFKNITIKHLSQFDSGVFDKKTQVVSTYVQIGDLR